MQKVKEFMREFTLAKIVLEILHFIFLIVLFDFLPFGLKSIGFAILLVWLLTLAIEIRAKILLNLSFLFSFFILNLLAPLFMAQTYYRPHEKLEKINTGKYKKYAPNQNIAIEKGHGDLLAIGFAHPEILETKEERRLEFTTDANGYRNSNNNASQAAAILVGDSFVVGNSNTQKHTLSVQLQEKGFVTYNLGHNGDISEYFYSLRDMREKLKTTAPAILFVFEGNDFQQLNYCVESDSMVGGIRSWHRGIKETHLARFFSALWERYTMNKEKAAKAVRVITEPKTQKKIAFLEEYIEVANQEKYNEACLQSLMEKHLPQAGVKAIYFIPEKSRVYDFLLPKELKQLHEHSIYAKKMEQICNTMGIPFFDLTDSLRKRAKEGIAKDEFIFWRDDTHWNSLGMAVAVDEIIRTRIFP